MLIYDIVTSRYSNIVLDVYVITYSYIRIKNGRNVKQSHIILLVSIAILYIVSTVIF